MIPLPTGAPANEASARISDEPDGLVINFDGQERERGAMEMEISTPGRFVAVSTFSKRVSVTRYRPEKSRNTSGISPKTVV
jgi:hypothetical protein